MVYPEDLPRSLAVVTQGLLVAAAGLLAESAHQLLGLWAYQMLDYLLGDVGTDVLLVIVVRCFPSYPLGTTRRAVRLRHHFILSPLGVGGTLGKV